MATFSFSHPQYLLFLLMIPLLFFIHFLSLSNRKKTALRFANFDAIARIEGIDFFSKNVVMLILNIAVIVLLTFSISGLTLHTFKEASTFSFVIAIDSSRSMEADDFFPDRLTVAKETAKDFVDNIPYGSKIGIISFSGSSFLEQDMTDDRILVKNSIDNIQLSTFGGTDLYEASITATNLLKDEDAKSIIFLSDGQLNVGTIEEVINYANDNDVVIHTIAIGTEEGGLTSYALSKVDEDSLKSISYNTGGIFFNVKNQNDLSQSFSDILRLTTKKVSIPLYNYLLVFAIVLFLVGIFLSNTRYLNLP